MNFKPSLTEGIAIWGGITGTVSLSMTYFAYKRDRAKVKLVFKKGWNVVNSPRHDPKKKYASLSVYNQGRRPVTISKAGYAFLKKNGGAILSDSTIYGSRKLSEGTGVDYLIEEGLLEDLSEISYFAAYDAVGGTYKFFVAPFYKRFLYWFLDVTHVSEKPNIVKKNKKGK